VIPLALLESMLRWRPARQISRRLDWLRIGRRAR
jgi:hypothetical protein